MVDSHLPFVFFLEGNAICSCFRLRMFLDESAKNQRHIEGTHKHTKLKEDNVVEFAEAGETL